MSSYPELQETISYLVSEEKRLKGNLCLMADLLASLAFVVDETIWHYLNSDLEDYHIDNLQFVLKQITIDENS